MQREKRNTLLTMLLAMGLGLTLHPALAADNPFAAQSLAGGYHLAANDAKPTEAKCGVGKCGAGKCGAGMMAEPQKPAKQKAKPKTGEGKCGAKSGEGKCGAAPATESKCGGANKK